MAGDEYICRGWRLIIDTVAASDDRQFARLLHGDLIVVKPPPDAYEGDVPVEVIAELLRRAGWTITPPQGGEGRRG